MARSQNEEKSLYEKLIVEQKVRNIIINNLRINDSRIPLLKKNKVNFVAWGRTQNLKNYSWVDLDNHKSMQIIFDHLIKKNHEKIAFININKKFNFAYQRMKTYLGEIKKYKINFDKNLYIEIPKNDSLLSEEVTRKLLKNKKVTAIICCTEYIAAGAIRACNDLKIKIGHDISLITYDSLIVSNLITPKITSISHPTEDLGYNAVKLLMNKNGNDSKNNFYMAKPTIIDRDSVKKL
jgi:DNA-binding LacI/PurR family transcriptional regulator